MVYPEIRLTRVKTTAAKLEQAVARQKNPKIRVFLARTCKRLSEKERLQQALCKNMRKKSIDGPEPRDSSRSRKVATKTTSPIETSCFAKKMRSAEPTASPFSGNLKALKFVRPLGAGAEGVVIEAEQGGLRLAVKMIELPASMKVGTLYPHPTKADLKVREMALEHESLIMEKLTGSPNVISLMGVYHNYRGKITAIACELAEQNLYEKMTELTLGRQKLPEKTIASWIVQAATGLAYIHSKRIIHMDIKPENLLLGLDGVVKVADFGMAIDLSGQKTDTIETDEYSGTRKYMAPEMISLALGTASTTEYGFPVDIYSLGKVVEDFVYAAPRTQLVLALNMMSKMHMLKQNPEQRYTANQVVTEVSKLY